ncbi:oligopeptidase PepB [Oenococcus oeni S23]|uniref:oligoendopeptidase F n=1 Tax=Oenococcus oeni TaxID=1247 RepID=UPI00050EEFF5|nr:oligoendopeptidase F [Oenococcus oeni]KGH94330.1 oligopeptidase PepB [Oenococcus oeni S23]
MTESKKQITRAEVEKNPAQTWDLSKIFKTDDDWEKAFQSSETKIKGVSQLAATVKDAKSLLHAIKSILDMYRLVETVYVYASRKSDQDTSNNKYAAFNARVGSLAAQAESASSFLTPAIIAFTPDELASFYQDEPELEDYRHMIDSYVRNRDHTLTPAEEKLLAAAGDVLSNSSQIFSVLNDSDLKYDDVVDETGEKVELTQGLYSRMLESDNRQIRKTAFTTLYKAYDKLKNTFASTLYGQMKSDNFLALAHKFKSDLEAETFSHNIPETVFNTLITTTDQHLNLLHRYVSLRKKLLGLSELHSYDLYTPITGKVDFPVDFEGAKAIVLEALKPLGDEYLNGIQREFDERWIDVPENAGKRSGAYSDGAYDTVPYILLNWQDMLDNVFTLVHESGHSQHSLLTRSNQPYQYGDYPIFLAEIASTTNEMLLTDYLLKTQSDPKIRAYVLNHYLDGFKGTVFRQTQFAEFEDWMHKEAQKGNVLTAETLSKFYGDLNKKFYGDSLTFDSQIALEWARIPHFYYNYYVYQYATGESAATTLSQGIIEDPKRNVPLYLSYLSAGSSDYPLNIIKKAGVDMEKPDYLNKAFDVFEKRLNEFEELVTN